MTGHAGCSATAKGPLMKDSIDYVPPDLAADLAFRRRALTVNCNIYALRHAPRFVPLLTRGMRGRYVARVATLGTERACTQEDSRRVAALADEIDALGSQRPRIAETCRWHAARLRELVGQHAAIVRLEAGLTTQPTEAPSAKRTDVTYHRGPCQAVVQQPRT